MHLGLLACSILLPGLRHHQRLILPTPHTVFSTMPSTMRPGINSHLITKRASQGLTPSIAHLLLGTKAHALLQNGGEGDDGGGGRKWEWYLGWGWASHPCLFVLLLCGAVFCCCAAVQCTCERQFLLYYVNVCIVPEQQLDITHRTSVLIIGTLNDCYLNLFRFQFDITQHRDHAALAPPVDCAPSLTTQSLSCPADCIAPMLCCAGAWSLSYGRIGARQGLVNIYLPYHNYTVRNR